MFILAVIPLVGAGCSKQVGFEKDVRPILTDNCVRCHTGSGEGVGASGFSVQDYDSLMKGTKFGPVVVAGDSASSSLDRVIDHQADPEIQMPPHHDVSLAKGRGAPLTDHQIETIRMWIDQGARNN